ALPLHGRALVAADVDVARREDGDGLAQHLTAEVEYLVVYAEHVLADPPGGPHRQRAVGIVAQLGVGGEDRPRMARHLDLGYHRDAALLRVLDQGAQLALGVEAAVRAAVEGGTRRRRADHGLRAPGADLGQPRQAVDLDAPALVLGEVQV